MGGKRRKKSVKNVCGENLEEVIDVPYRAVAVSVSNDLGQFLFGSCLGLGRVLQTLLGSLELVAQVVLLLQRVHSLLQMSLKPLVGF